MIPAEIQQAMQQWLAQATPPEQQMDHRWIGRYRELSSHDSFWWLSWAGPFTVEEQQQWHRLFLPPVDEQTKNQLAPLLKGSFEREIEAARAAQREPHLWYPAIEIDEVRHRIAGLVELGIQIEQEEPDEIVRQLYQGAIEEETQYLRIVEATYEKNTERFWELNQAVFQTPTPDEMAYAISWVKRLLQQGFAQPETAEISQQLLNYIQERLHLSLDLSASENEPPVAYALQPATARTVSVDVARLFYEAVLYESGYEGWRVNVDTSGGGVTRVEWGLRQLILVEESLTLEKIRHLLAHELAGHVARSFAGEHSPIGLLGIGTQNCSATEEGLALYYERQLVASHGGFFDDSGSVLGTLATGLATGIGTPPQTFSSLSPFIEQLIFLYRRLLRPWRNKESDQKVARKLALTRCLRTFRGVPELEKAGVCYLQDATYLRGILEIERLASQHEEMLKRLAVGMIACDRLSILQPLKIAPPPQPLQSILGDPELDTYILSFENIKEGVAQIS
ncbi:MAG: hypothetical protein ACYDER_03235 [Ktedonobacteraceae bacterium]